MRLLVSYGIEEETKAFKACFELIEKGEKFEHLYFDLPSDPFFDMPFLLWFKNDNYPYYMKDKTYILGYDLQNLEYRVRESIGYIQKRIRQYNHEEFPTNLLPLTIDIPLA